MPEPNLELQLQGQDEYVCRGRYGCGALVLKDDIERHIDFHARLGDPMPAPEANHDPYNG